LTHSLELQNDSIKVIQTSGETDQWTVFADSKTCEFAIRSCLRHERMNLDIALDISDYQLTHELPEVATAIVSELD
jgi:hypothetical protein